MCIFDYVYIFIHVYIQSRHPKLTRTSTRKNQVLMGKNTMIRRALQVGHDRHPEANACRTAGEFQNPADP